MVALEPTLSPNVPPQRAPTMLVTRPSWSSADGDDDDHQRPDLQADAAASLLAPPRVRLPPPTHCRGDGFIGPIAQGMTRLNLGSSALAVPSVDMEEVLAETHREGVTDPGWSNDSPAAAQADAADG